MKSTLARSFMILFVSGTLGCNDSRTASSDSATPSLPTTNTPHQQTKPSENATEPVQPDYTGNADANAENFPYVAGRLRWSATLTPPADGRIFSGFTNGCVRLNKQKQTILGGDKYPIYDSSMCTSTSDKQVVVADSEAATACETIGGRLPTNAQIHAMIRRSYDYYLENGRPILTAKGIAALSRDLGEDISQQVFWTSSLFLDSPDYGYHFSGDYGGVVFDFSRNDYSAVRCVREIP